MIFAIIISFMKFLLCLLLLMYFILKISDSRFTWIHV